MAVAGGLALTEFADADQQCRIRCDVEQLDSVDRLAIIADVGLGVAVAGAIVGTVWLLTSGDGDGDDDRAVEVEPTMSTTSFGLRATGSF